jgi:uncharacterized protein YlxP (DUF503 family)
MVIGLLEMILSMPENRSLKDKRMVLRSLKDRVHNKFNVSIAEVAEQDRWTKAQLAATVVSVDCTHAHKILESVVKYVEGHGGAVLRDYQIQML